MKNRRTIIAISALVINLGLVVAAVNAQTSDAVVKQRLNEGYRYLRDSNYAQAIASFKSAVQADRSNVRARLDLAYTLLSAGQDKAAIEEFEQAVRLEPTNIQVRSQLGYLYIHLDRARDALRQFLEVEKLDPNNYRVKTQLGYLYDKLGDKEQARELFSEATASSDPEITAKAHQALKNLTPGGSPRAGAVISEIYGAPFHQSRFGNFIAPIVVRTGVVLEQSHGVEAYTSVRLTRDSRSTGGSAPQIYSDNSVVASVGLKARPFKSGLTVYGEAGIATNLLRSALSTYRSRSDYRAGIYYSREWGNQGEAAGASMPFKLIGDVYFDASYYSRFRNNVIGYAQARPGVRFFQWNKSSVDAYARLAAVKDTGRDFYNNIGEGGAGFRFTPYRPLGVSVSAEYVRGVYFGIQRPGEPNPYGSHYNDFRLMITLGKYYARE
jgi:tetratricopeptide (TPR) repeat protein